MKIPAVGQIKEADAYTIKHEPIVSIDLMERAAGKCFQWIVMNYGRSVTYKIFCGTGNNGGDGLAIARLMAEKNIKVETYVVRFSEKCSDDFNSNLQKLLKFKKVKVADINAPSEFPAVEDNDVIIDAIFGSGLTKPVADGIASDVIKLINKSKAKVIAIDIPSGLFVDDNSDNEGDIVHAKQTLTFQFPKLSFLFAGNEPYVGKWQLLPIGLHKAFIRDVAVNNYFVEAEDCHNILKPRSNFGHKGTYGHALLVCGSFGKMGAAVISTHSCIRSGTGLVTAHIPECGYTIMQTAAPEIMCSMDSDNKVLTDNIDISTYNAIGVGPGIGTDEKTQKALKLLIQNSGNPMVFDADAINILSENKTWLSFVPKHSIFTPHPKEFERLSGKSANENKRQQLQIEFSKKYCVYVVLKGAYTCISTPAGDCYFNSTGNPGMATAGSGDVLTGIITGLLAQKYTSFEACLLGVFVHGLAGDIAAKQLGYEALTANDIISFLGKAFKKLYI
jgi:ADP-dependent NAD(P)H-hydrate dehydratase / NAD(P)H-hydrate epimerase